VSWYARQNVKLTLPHWHAGGLWRGRVHRRCSARQLWHTLSVLNMYDELCIIYDLKVFEFELGVVCVCVAYTGRHAIGADELPTRIDRWCRHARQQYSVPLMEQTRSPAPRPVRTHRPALHGHGHPSAACAADHPNTCYLKFALGAKVFTPCRVWGPRATDSADSSGVNIAALVGGLVFFFGDYPVVHLHVLPTRMLSPRASSYDNRLSARYWGSCLRGAILCAPTQHYAGGACQRQ